MLQSMAFFGGSNDYLYNGKELDEEHGLNWYHYGFRMYDPAIGRFPSLDPKADAFAFVSPYNYAENEPIANIDLWGLQKHKASDGSLISGPYRDQKQVDKAAVSRGLQGVASYGAYSGIGAQVERVRYDKTIAKLNPKDSRGRFAAKVISRQVTPSIPKAFLDDLRPLGKETNKTSVSSANKSNPGFNEKAGKIGKIGRIAGGASAALSVYNVATSEDKSKAVASEVGALGGAIVGGEIGAEAGAGIGLFFAGVGAAPGAVIGGGLGSIIGAIVGSQTGEQVHDKVVNRETEKK